MLNEKLLEHPYFIQCLSDFVSFKMDDDTTKDKSLNQLETIGREIKNQKIKDKLAYEITKFGITQTKNLDAVYTKFISIQKNELMINNIHKNGN